MSPREKSLETCMEVVHASNYFQSPAERELFLLFLIGRVLRLLEEVGHEKTDLITLIERHLKALDASPDLIQSLREVVDTAIAEQQPYPEFTQAFAHTVEAHAGPAAEVEVKAEPDYKAMFCSAVSVLAEIDRLLGLNDDCAHPNITLTSVRDLVQGKGAGGLTAIRILRQIAGGPRKTREVRLARACVTFLETLGTANASGLPQNSVQLLKKALDAADELAAALDQSEDQSSRAALLQKAYSLRELGCMRIGLRTHRKEMARFIVDMPLHLRTSDFDADMEADLLTASQLIRELETVLPE